MDRTQPQKLYGMKTPCVVAIPCGFFNVWNDSFANEFYWNFSDGTWVEGDSVHVTFVDTGWINLEYIVGHHGCMDTVLL